VLYPFTFHPIFQSRVWGGQRLKTLFGKDIPADEPIGESWEIADRPGAESSIANGPLASRTLRWLMEEHSAALLGELPARDGRFPWLAKLLDAREDLSVQVHPPVATAKQLGGESKTEAWFIAHAEPDARIIAGLRSGIDRSQFEKHIGTADLTHCLHALPAREDDSIVIPNGRLHSLGAGTVVFEIQENADTTYRVFDWNRQGLNGAPRELHVDAALQCVNFSDHEPAASEPDWELADGHQSQRIASESGAFALDHIRLTADRIPLPGTGVRMIGVTAGTVTVSGDEPLTLAVGQFGLVPAALKSIEVAGRGSQFLLTQAA